MNFHRGEISTVKKINLKKAYKILQTRKNQKIMKLNKEDLKIISTVQLKIKNH